MPSSMPEIVLSHWSRLLENLAASPLSFYLAVESALKRRQIPGAGMLRVDWHEGGVLSAKREYLRVSRGQHVFDICGAPFGTGFFVSAWLVKPRSGMWPVALFFLFIAVFGGIPISWKIFGLMTGTILFMIGFPCIFWIFAQIMNEQKPGWDDAIEAIPIIGRLYCVLFKREDTYYQIDTTLMFQQAVHNAVMEVIDEISVCQGLQVLSELERKPVFTCFGTN